jgi:heme exporter protein B
MTGAQLTMVLLRKDLRIAVRTREVLGLMILFAVLCVLVFAFGFLREGADPQEFVPGVLWVTLLFSGTVGLLRLFTAEEEGGTLHLVAASHAGSWPLFVAKAIVQLTFAGVTTFVVLPLTLLFFQADLTGAPILLLALVLGLIGISLVGTLCASLLIGVRMREVLLPLVLYPTVAPLLIAGVKSTALALAGEQLDAAGTWLLLMLVFDLVFLALAPWLHGRALSG